MGLTVTVMLNELFNLQRECKLNNVSFEKVFKESGAGGVMFFSRSNG